MNKKPGFILLFLLVCYIGLSNNIRYKIVVSHDGTGDFTSIQDAVDATKSFPGKRITIFIKAGVYKEKVRIPSWNNKLSLIGEGINKTIITYDDYFAKINRGRNSTFFTYTLLVEADDFYAENLTIENTAGEVGQAVALHVEGDRCVFKNCRILGNQDTLYVSGENSRQYYSNCYIEGTTDFIFGSATVFFSECEIKSKRNSYITAASTTKGKKYGFVFSKCKLTAVKKVSEVYLGRPWRPYAKTVFLNCKLGKHINPEGWKEWSNASDKTTTFYAEYNNTGPGARTAKRVTWSHQLTAEEAQGYTIRSILCNWVEDFDNY